MQYIVVAFYEEGEISIVSNTKIPIPNLVLSRARLANKLAGFGKRQTTDFELAQNKYLFCDLSHDSLFSQSALWNLIAQQRSGPHKFLLHPTLPMGQSMTKT